MSKAKNKSLKRRQMRRIANRSMLGGQRKMLGRLVRFGHGDGRPGRVRAEGEVL